MFYSLASAKETAMIRPAACLLALAPLYASVGACVKAPPMDQPDSPVATGRCNAAAGQSFLGQRATPEVGQRLLAATGARVLRQLPPNSVMTMDYSEDRLNIFHDENLVIERITCG